MAGRQRLRDIETGCAPRMACWRALAIEWVIRLMRAGGGWRIVTAENAREVPMVTTERTGAANPVDGWVRAGELAELAAAGVRVVSGGRHGIAVVAYWDGGDLRVAAVD